jgi:predicted DNA-binding transcriptional regulator YafY
MSLQHHRQRFRVLQLTRIRDSQFSHRPIKHRATCSLADASLGTTRSASAFQPLIARHDSAHELIKKRNRERCVPVTGTPDHPLGDELIARRTE